MPRPRFTLRWLMVAVAIVGVALTGAQWVAEMSTRRAVYLNRATHFAQLEADYREVADQQAVIPGYRETRLKTMAKAKRFGEIRRKYERAARYPWLPDPPEPE